MELRDSAALERVRQLWRSAAFVNHLGMELLEVGPGWVETGLEVRPELTQAERFVHAGVVATLGDHSAGAASGTLMGPDQTVLTVEFKINLLRPAVGERLRCRAEVIKPGRSFCVVESRIHAIQGERSELVALLIATVAVVPIPGSTGRRPAS